MNIHFSDIEDIIRETLDMGKSFKISPNGKSMIPLLYQGKDSVFIEKPKGRLKKYDIAFFKRDDAHFVLHRVISVQKNTYTMCGDNQWIIEPGIRDDQIIGVVTQIEKDGRLFSVSDKAYRRYSFFRVNTRIIRNLNKIIIYKLKRIIRKII